MSWFIVIFAVAAIWGGSILFVLYHIVTAPKMTDDGRRIPEPKPQATAADTRRDRPARRPANPFSNPASLSDSFNPADWQT